MRWVWWSRKRDPRVVGEKSSNLAFFQKIMFLASHNHIPAVELIKLSARLKKNFEPDRLIQQKLGQMKKVAAQKIRLILRMIL